MKKIIMLVAACAATAFLQGMENQNSVSFLLGKTMVRLTQGCIYDFDRTVDLMVVGRNEQRILKDFDFVDISWVGRVREVENDTVYIKNKGTDSPSDSDDDTYTKLWHNAPTKQLNCRVISVVEPWIVQEGYCGDICPLKPGCFYSKNQYQSFYENGLIMEAKKDLACCYHEVFDAGQRGERRIALPLLGIGFSIEDTASAAVTAILTYIRTTKKNPYHLIYLVVKKQSVFELCKTLLYKELENKKEFL